MLINDWRLYLGHTWGHGDVLSSLVWVSPSDQLGVTGASSGWSSGAITWQPTPGLWFAASRRSAGVTSSSRSCFPAAPPPSSSGLPHQDVVGVTSPSRNLSRSRCSPFSQVGGPSPQPVAREGPPWLISTTLQTRHLGFCAQRRGLVWTRPSNCCSKQWNRALTTALPIMKRGQYMSGPV